MKLKILLGEGFKSVFLILAVITGFIFIVAFSSLYVSDAIKNNNACGCVIPIPFMILILSSLGIFVGSLLSYFTASKYLKERASMDKNTEVALNFLNPDERVIVKQLIANKPGLKQSEFEKLTGMHKVKIHRILQKLKSKNIIEKEDSGKTNKIRLKEELVRLFC